MVGFSCHGIGLPRRISDVVIQYTRYTTWQDTPDIPRQENPNIGDVRNQQRGLLHLGGVVKIRSWLDPGQPCTSWVSNSRP
ncbi:hypothetical protein AVEN_128812-1 [Araneus ventricosus]|uniref:Uncharacterized protein n=1 Tax=Araneus ventricosus TaxID=182803 RepID=A0A4Y2K4L7_ARAVE|nr:hypothetical protein AVEN_128812-1 [Araneus ventricosus]